MIRAIASLDTTLLIDWFKFPGRRQRIQEVLRDYDWTIATDVAILEFKAVYIQQMVYIHNILRHYGRFTRARDVACEKATRQVQLRIHIFNNQLNVRALTSAFEITDEEDARLAEEARLQIKSLIPKMWKDVHAITESVQHVMKCDRATEPPKFQGKTFAPTLPTCQRGKNKSCDIESFIRDFLAPKIDELTAIAADKNLDQLNKAVGIVTEVRDNATIDISSSKCRGAGDCLLSACSKQVGSTHAVSTNASEWEPLSKLFGMEFVHVKYPDEKV